EALPRDRMDHVRGVADQRHPLGDEGARDKVGKRKRAWLVERLDLPEMQAEAFFELAVEFVLAQRGDARGLSSLFGPHQRRAPSFQRQDRERARGQKMFFGAAAVITLMTDAD